MRWPPRYLWGLSWSTRDANFRRRQSGVRSGAVSSQRIAIREAAHRTNPPPGLYGASSTSLRLKSRSLQPRGLPGIFSYVIAGVANEVDAVNQ